MTTKGSGTAALRHSMRLTTREELLEDCYQTVWAIAASRYCAEFVVGYTHRASRARQGQYFNATALGYQHLVLLVDRMTQPDAFWLEEHLQARLKANVDTDEALSKFRRKNALDIYRRSSGGVTLDDAEKSCSIYMAWLEP